LRRLKVLLDILYGPLAVDTENAKRFEHHRTHCVGEMYDVDAITPQMIAYSAVVVCVSFHFILLRFNLFVVYSIGSLRTLLKALVELQGR
jgi:hypothetical protein